MQHVKRVLVFQTAFIGDLVLTLPLVQAIARRIPQALVDVVAIPSAANILENHPAVCQAIVYDKRGAEAGLRGIHSISRRLRKQRYDIALVPHRSMRSALIPKLAGVPVRVGFTKSAGRLLFTHTVKYQQAIHEIERNLSLLTALKIIPPDRELPRVYPGPRDQQVVDELIKKDANPSGSTSPDIVALAPGSIWNTKRWPKEYFVELVKLLVAAGTLVVLVGGTDDTVLCEEIRASAGQSHITNAAGKLTLLQSAELIRRTRILVSNDSAPMHLAVAVRTPVVAIFGATVPEFGFAPLGVHDQVMGTAGLNCRPCSIHGGNACPITTFDCMRRIVPTMVFERVNGLLQLSSHTAG